MLLHVDHLVPGMVLEKDIELRAGSYLITRNELSKGQLNEKNIEGIRKFSSQILPEKDRVHILSDEFALGCIKNVVRKDLHRIADAVTSGKDRPNYLEDFQLQEKVMRTMEILFSNPNIIQTMYEARIGTSDGNTELELILDHCIRTSMLSMALGLRLKLTIFSLLSIGMASLLHDMGIFCTSAYPNMKSLDDISQEMLKEFIEQHQEHSGRLFNEQELTINSLQRKDIFHILTNHHSPDPDDNMHKNTLIFHFADLLDEMTSYLPHEVRYNFSGAQLEILGKRYSRRNGIANVLLGLTRLYKPKGGLPWKIISNLAGLFKLNPLLSGDYEEKLQETLDWCPFESARAYPALTGNALPRTVFCKKSVDPEFKCYYLLYITVQIQSKPGKLKDYFKCSTLGSRLQELNDRSK